VTCEEHIFLFESGGADQRFDAIVVDLDAAIGQEGL
jgi:hypothetical protein